jgi:hypothetical protein
MEAKEYAEYLIDKYDYELGTDIISRRLDKAVDAIVEAEIASLDTDELCKHYEYLNEVYEHTQDMFIDNIRFIANRDSDDILN